MIRHLASACLLLATVAAQQPFLPDLLAPSSRRTATIADPLEDGTIWVRGERFKLALATDAVTFQPLFGPHSPRDYPMHFTLLGCEVGDERVPLEGAVAWQRTAHHFERNRGALRECWNVTQEAAQQYFVVDQPATAGRLTLRIGVAGDLHGIDEGPGVHFVAPGLGSVRYSDAVVFDAAGRRLEVPVELVGQTLTITVPAAFTGTATWPLVVDPLVTTVAIDTTVSNIEDPKVTCEPTTGNWLVVAEEHLSATDVDILCKRYDSASPPNLLDTTYADSSANFTHNPDVGFLAPTQQFLVAWHNTASNGNFQFRFRSAASTTQGNVFNTSSGIGGNLDNRPRIGSSLSGNRALLVLFRKNTSGSSIFAQLLGNTGTTFGTLFVGPVASPVQGTVAPGDVSTIADAADKWVVVWRECTTAACTSQVVRMQAIGLTNGSGPLLPEPTMQLATGGLEDEPSIGGHGGKLLAAWRSFDATTLSNDIHGVPIGITGGSFGPLGTVQNLSAQEPNVNNAREQTRPSVSFDGVRFVYGYLEDDGNDTVLPHAATVYATGPSIAWHEGHLPLSTVETRAIDLGHGGPARVGIHWAAWQQDSAAFTGDVIAAQIDARKPGLTSVVDQTGCGLPNEPGISLSGTPAIGRTFTVSMNAPGALPILLVGQPSINLMPGCNNCRTGVDTTTMLAFMQLAITVVVPNDPGLLQLRLGFQGLAGLQIGGCPPSYAGAGFDFAMSDTITVQIL